MKQTQKSFSYREIVENIHDALVIFRGTQILYANSMIRENYGLDIHDLNATSVWNAVHPDDRENMKEISRKRQSGGDAPSRYSIRFLTPKLGVIHAEIIISSIHFEGAPAFLMSIRDVSEREMLIRELTASEERYRTLQDSLPVGIFQINRSGEILSMNYAAREIFGVDLDMPCEQLNIAAFMLDRKRVERGLKIIREHGRLRDFEILVQRSDRTPFWAEINMNPSGRPLDSDLRYEGTVTNVTERRMLRVELKDAKERFENLIYSIEDVIWSAKYDKDGELLYYFVSPTIEKLTGYSSMDLGDDPVFNVIHPDDIEKVRKARSRLTKNSFTVVEYRITDSNGIMKWVMEKTSANHFPDGTYELDSILSDVSSIKRSLERLRSSEEMLRALFDSTPDIILVKNSDLVYTHANRSVTKLFSLLPEEIIGNTDDNMFSGDVLHKIREEDRRVLSGEKLFISDAYEIGQNRAEMKIIKIPLWGRDGRIEGVCIIGHEITGVRNMEREITLMKDILSRTRDPVMVLDSAYNLIFVNNALVRFTSPQSEELSISVKPWLIVGLKTDAFIEIVKGLHETPHEISSRIGSEDYTIRFEKLFPDLPVEHHRYVLQILK